MRFKQITILGCGLSGMITALGLASKGIKSTIIDSKKSSSISDNRTTALTQGSRKILSEYKIWDELESLGGVMKDIYVLDNKSEDMVHLKSEGHDSDALGYIFPNNDFKNILLEKVLANENITLIQETPYLDIKSEEEKTILNFENEQIISDLTIICEGQNSLARRKYFTNKIDKNYNQVALTFNVAHDKPHDGTAVEHFMPSGPFAILPLASGYQSSIVWTISDKLTKIFKNFTQEELTYNLKRNFGDFLGEIKIISEVNFFPLKASITNRYFYNRIVLVADSAHIIHPLAGQGLNQGIKDIDALVKLLSSAPPSLKLLEQYEILRQEDNLHMHYLTYNLNSFFSNEFLILTTMRKIGLALFDKIPLAKRFLLDYASGRRE